MIKTCSVTMKLLESHETIPAGAFHSEDDIVFLPIFNPEETVGKKVSDFTRNFYVIHGLYIINPDESNDFHTYLP